MSRMEYVGTGKNDKTVLLLRRIFSYVVLILIAIISLFPFYMLIINASRPHSAIMSGFSMFPGTFFGTNFKNLMNEPEIPVVQGMINSFIVAGLNCILSVYFSAMTAYGIHAYDFKLKKPAFTFILVIMMVPAQVSALGFVRLVRSFNMLNTYWPLIIPGIAAPATFFFIKQYMESAVPLDIVEAARIDGCGEFRTFNQIIFPMLKPAVAVQAIFTFVAAWNNYFLPALILEDKAKKTLPILIAQLRGADFLKFDMGKVYMAILLSILPVAVVYLVLSKFIIRGITLGAVKG